MTRFAARQTYAFPEGTLGVLGNDVLVETDPLADRSASGLIIYPGGAVEHVMSTGTIRAYGTHPLPNGKCIPIPGIEIGLKCCFVRFRREQHTNLQLRKLFGDNFILLKPADLLFVYDEEDHKRVL